MFGTSSLVSKNLELASIVSSANSTFLVLESKDGPGSLKPMCPFVPIREFASQLDFL